MRRRRWVVLVVLLLGGLAAVWRGSRSAEPPSGTGRPREGPSGQEAEIALRGRPAATPGKRAEGGDPPQAAQGGDPSSAPGADAPADATAPRPAEVELLVLDPAGRPVPGADVEVPLCRTRTDRQGKARLPPWGFDMGTPRQDRHWKTVRVHAAGFVPVAYLGGRSREVVRLETRGGSVSGLCTDAEGRALSGVTLRLAWRQWPADLEILAVTGEDGRFTFLDAPWAPARIEAEGRTWTTDPVEVVPPQDDVRLRLVPARAESAPAAVAPPAEETPAGDGLDAAWVEVDAREIADLYLGVTAVMTDGRVRDLGWVETRTLRRLPLPSQDLEGLLLPDAFTQVAWRQAAAAGATVRLARPAGAPVRFRLLDATASPIEDGVAYVRWSGLPRLATSGRRGAAGQGEASGLSAPGPGEFTVPNVPPGTYDLVWRGGTHSRYALLRRGLVMPDPAGPLDLGDVILPAPVEVVVLVTDGAGPVAGAVVRVGSAHDDVFARADRDGLCRLSVPDPVDLSVEATHPEKGRGTARVASASAGTVVTVVLRPERRSVEPGR